MEFPAADGQRLEVVDVGLRGGIARLTPAPALAVGCQQGFPFFGQRIRIDAAIYGIGDDGDKVSVIEVSGDSPDRTLEPLLMFHLSLLDGWRLGEPFLLFLDLREGRPLPLEYLLTLAFEIGDTFFNRTTVAGLLFFGHAMLL
jgi:hypothetical protein